MVFIKMLELTEDRVVYEYFPENKEKSGKVALNRKTGERVILEKAVEYLNTYAFHALKRIEEYDAAGAFKDKDMISWY